MSNRSNSENLALFDEPALARPLADSMRAASFQEFVGFERLPEALRKQLLADDHSAPPSLILWGPPGCGKTTLARLIGKKFALRFVELSAVVTGIKEVKSLFEKTTASTPTLLFIDEIHRFNKAQQDAFLPHVESGRIVLIGATTENPGFSIIRSLLSRCQLVTLEPLSEVEIQRLVLRAAQTLNVVIDAETEFSAQRIAHAAGGDARRALGTLEVLARGHAGASLQRARAEDFLASDTRYHYHDDLHFELLSAFIKSMRASSPDAALYYGFRLLAAGADPQLLLRRMIIFSSEDIGNADPRAFSLANATAQAFERVGLPEAEIPIAQCICYLATAPKSNRSYIAMKNVKELVKRFPHLPVPMHLRNAPTKIHSEQGYGAGYRYPHDEDLSSEELSHYLPEEIRNEALYEPSDVGYEARLLRTRVKK